MRAFVVRPFGTRKGIDFEKVHAELIQPALNAIGAAGGTTGQVIEAGNIRIDMFRELLVADIVVADISTNNPNAFYELGIRHALQEKRTFLIRAQATAEERKDEQVPFDLRTERYLEYDASAPGKSLADFTAALTATAASERQDSPVFLLLPDLKSQDRERFIPVPLGFGEAVQRAEKGKDAVMLTLLGLEARDFSWESTGTRTVGRALLLIKQFSAARTAWESLRRLNDLDLEANIKLGNIYQRLDDLTASDQALQRAEECASSAADLAEIHGQLGRNRKALWVRAWRPAPDKARAALESPLLMDAYRQYLTAYHHDLNAYYPGINALGLAVTMVELARQLPDVWAGSFGDDEEAAATLKEISSKRDQLAGALQLRFETAGKQEASEKDKEDAWLLSSAGDLNLLTNQDARRAITFYRKAANDWGDFVLDAVRKQVVLFSELGVLGAKAAEALKVLPAEAPAEPDQRIDRLILFTGHRIDAAPRKTPRFPADREDAARKAIRAALEEEKAIANGPLLGVAGGANGGDILFLEQCQELDIPTKMMLVLPEGQFITESVDAEDKSWVTRFYRLLRAHPETPVLAQSQELPKWLQLKKNYDIWQRNNLWLLSEALCRVPRQLTLMALWDGAAGDGPGGTEHMVGLAKERGARFVHLDTKRLFGLLAMVLLLISLASGTLRADSLTQFSGDFWQWRAVEQPFSEDDIPRIERPANLAIDWSATTIQKRREEWADFETRWKSLQPPTSAAPKEQVDYRLMGSALARVKWELDIEQGWKRNPEFYVDQTLGAMQILLLPPPPFQSERQQELVQRLESIPATIHAAEANLTDARQPFARLAIAALEQTPERMGRMRTALAPQLSPETNAAVKKASGAAVEALMEYRGWLQERLPRMRTDTAIGREGYLFFLMNVALSPYSPEQLLMMSRQEWSRAVSFEAYEQARDAGLPPLPLFASQQEQMARETQDEAQVRALLARQHLLTVPTTMKHYRNLPLPDYVQPFAGLTVTDDLTGPSRLDQDGISYIHVPSTQLGFFSLSTAHDPRPIILHEGVPGHYFQLCLSWAHPDPIRRHYYDSGSNEGIGFYAEEMMLQAGLFEDSPKSREIIYSFMRLRALRVEVDVKLALGEFTLEQAADYLSKTVPMDHATALSEAAMFASTPGQAITYQVGKIQIMQMLSDARRAQGPAFSLQNFNDFVWINGNVPIALQYWEMLGHEFPAEQAASADRTSH